MSFMKWIVALAISPVAIAMDVVTLGWAINDRRKTYTQELVDSASE